MGGPSAILVDDEEDILPEYQDMLELEGFDALVSPDPEPAFHLVCTTPSIKLVITDLRMARLDGAGLIGKLRNALPDRNLPCRASPCLARPCGVSRSMPRLALPSFAAPDLAPPHSAMAHQTLPSHVLY